MIIAQTMSAPWIVIQTWGALARWHAKTRPDALAFEDKLGRQRSFGEFNRRINSPQPCNQVAGASERGRSTPHCRLQMPKEIFLVDRLPMCAVGKTLRKEPKRQFAPPAIQGVARRA